MTQSVRRISPMREFLILTRQGGILLLSDIKNLLISLAFPLIAAFIVVWIAGENMFVHYDGTKSACFVLVSAAIWGGLFNSIQTVVKERPNIRRDFMAGLRLRNYMASRAILQFLLCAVQSDILCFGFLGVSWKYGNALPHKGVLFSSPLAEFYVTILLLMYAADALGLMLSCLVRKPESANVLAPYVLIVQLIFSGILFSMEGAAEKLSYLMISRWGMEALGATSDLNALPLQIQLTVPTIAHEAEDMFSHTAAHLGTVWGILAAFAVGFVCLGNGLLHRVSKDPR